MIEYDTHESFKTLKGLRSRAHNGLVNVGLIHKQEIRAEMEKGIPNRISESPNVGRITYEEIRKWAFVFFLLCLLSGCANYVYDNGKSAITTYSNIKGSMTYKSKTLDFAFNGTMNNSTPTRAGGGIVATVGSDIVAGLVPGSGVVPIIGRAATATAPHLKSTTESTTTP